MNEIIRTLLERRSIRKFKPEQIRDDELNLILEAGMYAPSGANQQSALFVVVQDKETLTKLSAMNAAVLGKDIDPYYGAPTLIYYRRRESQLLSAASESARLISLEVGQLSLLPFAHAKSFYFRFLIPSVFFPSLRF